LIVCQGSILSALPHKLKTKSLNLWYGKFQALIGVSLAIKPNAITAIIGPSGCGKSTLLRALNRMNDLVSGSHAEGQAYLDDQPLYDSNVDVVDVRRRIGMVFQRPNPFPKSIYDNVAYGPRLYGVRKRSDLDALVEKALRQAETGTPVAEVIRKMGIAEQTFYNWKAKYGGMTVSEIRRMKALETENLQLKKLVAEQALSIQGLKEVLGKKL